VRDVVRFCPGPATSTHSPKFDRHMSGGDAPGRRRALRRRSEQLNAQRPIEFAAQTYIDGIGGVEHAATIDHDRVAQRPEHAVRHRRTTTTVRPQPYRRWSADQQRRRLARLQPARRTGVRLDDESAWAAASATPARELGPLHVVRQRGEDGRLVRRQTLEAGTVTSSGPFDGQTEVSVELNERCRFEDVVGNVKFPGYASAPSCRPGTSPLHPQGRRERQPSHRRAGEQRALRPARSGTRIDAGASGRRRASVRPWRVRPATVRSDASLSNDTLGVPDATWTTPRVRETLTVTASGAAWRVTTTRRAAVVPVATWSLRRP
jgi:hypothetical protein